MLKYTCCNCLSKGNEAKEYTDIVRMKKLCPSCYNVAYHPRQLAKRRPVGASCKSWLRNDPPEVGLVKKYPLDLTNTIVGSLYVINKISVTVKQTMWRVYCNRCHRYDETSSFVILNRSHSRCSKCFKVRFDYETCSTIAAKLKVKNNMAKICEEYGCAYKPVYSALKIVEKAEEFKEKDFTFKHLDDNVDKTLAKSLIKKIKRTTI